MKPGSLLESGIRKRKKAATEAAAFPYPVACV
jgi:hypothetical protein